MTLKNELNQDAPLAIMFSPPRAQSHKRADGSAVGTDGSVNDYTQDSGDGSLSHFQNLFQGPSANKNQGHEKASLLGSKKNNNDELGGSFVTHSRRHHSNASYDSLGMFASPASQKTPKAGPGGRKHSVSLPIQPSSNHTPSRFLFWKNLLLKHPRS